jgi:hypothetical protein
MGSGRSGHENGQPSPPHADVLQLSIITSFPVSGLWWEGEGECVSLSEDLLLQPHGLFKQRGSPGGFAGGLTRA